MKYLQKQPFVITGEGTNKALDNYRQNYELVFKKKKAK